MDAIRSIRGMEKLYLFTDRLGPTLPRMLDLQELALYDGGYFEDFETIARNLVNLKRVHIPQFKFLSI